MKSEVNLEEDLRIVVEGSDAAGSDRWMDALRRLDRVRVERAGALHPRLRHFLERRSYAKALAFIEEQIKPFRTTER